MCQIISYGFSKGGNILTGPACTGLTTDILSIKVSISVSSSDVGNTMTAFIEDVSRGGVVIANNLTSESFTPTYAPALYTFTIPLTGLTNQLGTYTFSYFGGQCILVRNPSTLAEYCSACSTTGCTALTMQQPCAYPGCEFTAT